MSPTNKQIANEIGTTSRQVSKCTRKRNPRGWLFLFASNEDGFPTKSLDFTETFTIKSARKHRKIKV